MAPRLTVSQPTLLGTLWFDNLEPNAYRVAVHDPSFRDVEETVNVNPVVSSFNMVQIQLDLKEDAKRPASSDRKTGSNPYLIDTSEYGRYPKTALKEFDRALQADREGKRDDAIKHTKRPCKSRRSSIKPTII